MLNDEDLDLAGSGPILIPGTSLIISGGKGGEFYLVDTTNMGHEVGGDLQIPQEFDNSNPPGSNDQIKGGPIYWNRDNSGVGPWMYVWSDGCNHFNAYHFNGTDFDTAAGVAEHRAVAMRLVRRRADACRRTAARRAPASSGSRCP